MKMEKKGDYLKKRRRTKKLLKDIKEQVEFYFSDVNLYHDKFLMQHVGSDGSQYVSLELLLSFKRLKEMCATPALLQKAIRESSTLQLSKDMKMVQRKAKCIQSPSYNADHYTIFIDSVPLGATVQWIKKFCNKLGPVRYISLPRFKSGSLKGYAFVEFSSIEDATLACSILNAPPKNFFPKLVQVLSTQKVCKIDSLSKNCKKNTLDSKSSKLLNNKRKLSEDNCNNHCKRVCVTNDFKPIKDNDNVNEVPINDICNITSFAKRQEKNNQNSLPVVNNDIKDTLPHASQTFDVEKDHLTEVEAKVVGNSCESDDSDTSTSLTAPSMKSKVTCVKPLKKQNRNSSVSVNVRSDCENQLAEAGKENPSVDTFAINCQLNSEVVIAKKLKHKRKRKRKHKLSSSDVSSSPSFSLHAMLKVEWMELKKQYLRQQRDNMGKLKSILQKSAVTDSETTSVYIKRHMALNNSAQENCTDDKKVNVNNEDINFKTKYLRSVSHSAPKFVPGVIAFVSSQDFYSSVNVKKLMPLPDHVVVKSHFSQYGGVAYVDIKQESATGYIRFEDTASAQRAILEEKKFGLRLLTGIEEESYWDALLISRQLKRSRERKKLSGKEKLVSKAEQITGMTSKKHIKFNSDF